jgi:hypothetical protein
MFKAQGTTEEELIYYQFPFEFVLSRISHQFALCTTDILQWSRLRFTMGGEL